MKSKEIYKYPYNVRPKNEIKFKKKKIILSAAIIFGGLFLIPADTKPVGIPARPASTREFNRPAQQSVYQHTPTINPKSDKITFTKYKEVPVFIYMMDEKFLRTSGLIKKIRGGNLYDVGFFIIIVIAWQVMGVGGFQSPIINPRGGVHRPANGGIQQHLNHPKHGGGIRVNLSKYNTYRSKKCSRFSY